MLRTDSNERVAPDYAGGGLLNLLASLRAGLGGGGAHPHCAMLPAQEVAAARHVVFFLIDGLGYLSLTTHGESTRLARHLRGALTSVFPSTTATAVTTGFTAASPVEHGMTGWFSWVGAANAVIAPLPFQARGSRLSLAERGVSPAKVFRAPSFLDTLAAECSVVTPAQLASSVYSRFHAGRATRIPYDGLARMVDAVCHCIGEARHRQFVHCYTPDFDAIAHRRGVASKQAIECLAAIDAAFGALVERLAGTDTLIVATADHGLIDTPERDALELPGKLARLLRRPLCGEPRVAFCHVQPGGAGDFIDQARAFLGERAEVMPSDEFIARGWFGPGEAHPDFAERIGEVTVLMNAHATVKDWVDGENPHRLIGNHGGPSPGEMRVPLVAVRV